MKNKSTEEQKTQDASRLQAGRYRWFALGILVVVYALNFLDRQIFSILQEAIKEDLDLSDTQLGFLGGLAFALLYATLGIPIARYADQNNRSKVIAASLTVWSAMTALCGIAQGFFSLALARVGVGIGEAGCSPPAHSIIADYFGRHQRATALAIYQCGVPIGMGLGFLIGGYVNVVLGWRAAFLIVGLPGLLMALFVLFFLREPPRGLSDNRATAAVASPPVPFWPSAKLLWSNATFRNVLFASAVAGFVNYGSSSWVPSFYIRSFGMDTATLSIYLAIAIGVFGGLSTLLGGFLGDWLSKHDERWLCWLPCLIFIFAKILFASMLFQDQFSRAMPLYFILSFVGSLHVGSMFALVQGLVPLGMRALAVSFVVFFTNLIGLGLGPLGVGIVSDILIAQGVENSLRWALLLVNVFAAWAIVHFYLASRTVRADLATALKQS